VLALAAWFLNRPRYAAFIVGFLKAGVKQVKKKTKSVAPRSLKWVVGLLLAGAALVTLAAANMPDDKVHVSFLDVGQGDAILVQQGSRQVLIDGGPTSEAITTQLGGNMPFWDRSIEMVVLTHFDSDHAAGLLEVLKRYQVERVVYPRIDAESGLNDKWAELVQDENATVTEAQAGQRIDLGGDFYFDVLNPQAGEEYTDDNDSSVVLRLNAGAVSFLLTGDISWREEFELLDERASLASTVLKVAHHGSENSSTEEFLAAVRPQMAVISVGKDNKYGHPTPETLSRLDKQVGEANIYRTDLQGTIEFVTDGSKLWMKN
jgi:competence protein ComEC